MNCGTSYGKAAELGRDCLNYYFFFAWTIFLLPTFLLVWSSEKCLKIETLILTLYFQLERAS